MKISVCVPSWHRPYKIKTSEYLPFIKVYIDPPEYNDYKKTNPGIELVKCKSGVQGNISRVRNYIIDEEFKRGADVVVTVDDDLKGIYCWEWRGENYPSSYLVRAEDFLSFIEKYSRLCREMGFLLWGLNINKDKQVYREYSPFSTTSFIGAPFQAILKGNVCRYDERLPLKEDYDFTLQNMNKYRGALRVNKFYYDVKQSEQAGGCATYRNFQREQEQLKFLQKKWGGATTGIVRIDNNDRSHNLKLKKTKIDYNPIIKVPIRGI